MYFDTHAHYDDEAFDIDRDALLRSLPEQGVTLVVAPATDGKSSEAILKMADAYPHVYAAVGWHPHEADSFDESAPDAICTWAKHPKVRAIGEISNIYSNDRIKTPLRRIGERGEGKFEQITWDEAISEIASAF